MVFLESSLDFPDEWYLQPLFYLFPIVGLGAVADSVIRLAFLMFTRKQNQPEWNRMLASLCRNHVVVVGVGRVGYQVIKELLELRESVVAIEQVSEAELLEALFDKKIPVIQGNARLPSILEQAGVRKAKAVIVTTGDDLTNLDIALEARELNETARIVIRLFDETLARKVAGAFAMPTVSTSQVVGPGLHRRGARPQGLSGIPARRPVRPPDRPGDQPHRQARRLDRRRAPGRQEDQHRHAPGAARRQRQPRRRRSSLSPERHDPRHRAGRVAAEAGRVEQFQGRG